MANRHLRGRIVSVDGRVAMITRCSNDGKWVAVQFTDDGKYPTSKWVEVRKVA